MAVAVLMLRKAGHAAESLAACDYLAKVQDADGGWFNQYDHTAVSTSSDGKFTRMTVEASLALIACDRTRYAANLQRALAFLLVQMDPAHKGGADDGLLGGGFAKDGTEIGDRWTSDNAYAALLFDLLGRGDLRDRVVAGINARLLAGASWTSSIRPDGTENAAPFDWIHFAPAQLGLDRMGVTFPAGLGDFIHQELQQSAGPDTGGLLDHQGGTKLMPGIGFQASLAWQHLGTVTYASAHRDWVEGPSGLWQTTPDANNDAGGFVDWKTLGASSTAPWWQRFVDTSAYYVMVVEGWHY
jgi:hypothetical protein